MNLGIGISHELQQKLSFGMIQGLKMLQVTAMQLEQMLRAELEQNPLLEIESELDTQLDDDIRGDDRDDDRDDERDNDREEEYLEELGKDNDNGEIDWEEYLEDGFDMGSTHREEVERFEDRYDAGQTYEETLAETLEKQLGDVKTSERIHLLVQFLIGSLDDDGYLRLSNDDIMELTGANICELEEALCILHRFEPAGVGARDLRECMMLQLSRRKMDDSAAMKIIRDHFALFEKLKIPDLAKKLSTDAREVQKAVDVLKTLTPKPGHQYSADKSSAITPDLIVEKVDGKFTVTLNDRSMPSLCINKTYADMARRGSKADKDAKDYIRERLNSATWFIKAIEQRRGTMIKVMYAIIEKQPLFFEKGPPHLAPLKQQDIADAIEMHLSTISRVTSNKYVQTRHGIFELKYFFTESLAKNTGNNARGKLSNANAAGANNINNISNINNVDDAASVAGAAGSVDDNDDGGAENFAPSGDVTPQRIKARIKHYIEDEDARAPLSDQKIADMLERENLPAARRTVAKYREQMKILPARMRQVYE